MWSTLRVLNDEETHRYVMSQGRQEIRHQCQYLKAHSALKEVLPAIAIYGYT